jgi:hypothetical protein
MSFNDSPFVLEFRSLNHVATKFIYLELHKVIFEVSKFLLIIGSQGLLNPMSTNC